MDEAVLTQASPAAEKSTKKPLNARLTALADKVRRKKAEPTPEPQLPALTVEPFDGQDYRLLSVLLGSCRKELGAPDLTQTQWAGLRCAVEEERVRFYIAWLHGQPVGVCALCLGYSSQRCAVTGTLEDLYVRPEARGNGVALALADCAAAAVAAAGGAVLTVCCTDAHRPLYAALGFDAVQGAGLVRRV